MAHAPASWGQVQEGGLGTAIVVCQGVCQVNRALWLPSACHCSAVTRLNWVAVVQAIIAR